MPTGVVTQVHPKMFLNLPLTEKEYDDILEYLVENQEELTRPDPVEHSFPKRPQSRTIVQVLYDRYNNGGCCSRHGDNQACECLQECEEYETWMNLGHPGYAGVSMSWSKEALNLLYPYPEKHTGCNICRNRHCLTPNGKH